MYSIQVLYLFCPVLREIGYKAGESTTSAANQDNFPVFVYSPIPFHVSVHLRADICSPNPYICIQVHSDRRLQGSPFVLPVLIHQSRSLHSQLHSRWRRS